MKHELLKGVAGLIRDIDCDASDEQCKLCKLCLIEADRLINALKAEAEKRRKEKSRLKLVE